MLTERVAACRRNGEPEESIKDRIARALIGSNLSNVAQSVGFVQPAEQQAVTYTCPETGKLETQV